MASATERRIYFGLMAAARRRWWGPRCAHRKNFGTGEVLECNGTAEHDSNFCAKHRAELIDLAKPKEPGSNWVLVSWLFVVAILAAISFVGLGGCSTDLFPDAPADPCFIYEVNTDGTRTCIETRADIERRGPR